MIDGSSQVYLNALRLFCRWLEDTHVIQWNPMTHVRSPKISPIFKKQPLSVEEVHQLLATIPTDTLVQVRDEADNFVVLMPEVTTLLDQYLATRPQPSPGQLQQASQPEAMISHEPQLPLFLTTGRRGGHRLSEITMQGIVREWLKLANVKRAAITGHSLRHTATTMSLDAGAPITAVKDMLRHSSIKQTNIYVHTMERVKRGGESFINQY